MGNSEWNYPSRLERFGISNLEAHPQWQWLIWWEEEARALEKWNRPRSINISQDQFLGEGQQAELQRQLEFNDHTLVLSCLAALNAWDKVEESGKRFRSFIKIIQGLKRSLHWPFAKIDLSCQSEGTQLFVGEYYFQVCDFCLCCICLTLWSCVTVPV